MDKQLHVNAAVQLGDVRAGLSRLPRRPLQWACTVMGGFGGSGVN